MTAYTIVGGGAIGGTLAVHLAEAGHDVLVVDSDAEHVAAIRARGLSLCGVGCPTGRCGCGR